MTTGEGGGCTGILSIYHPRPSHKEVPQQARDYVPVLA